MTKIHKTKLALLGATAFFAATSAHAQVADTWSITDDVSVSAANTGTATTLDPVNLAADAPSISDAKIDAGFKNSISAAAVGSSASSSFTSLNNSGLGSDAVGVTFAGAVSVAAGNSSAVLNNNDVATGATITGGSANSISLAAVGSSASVSGNTALTDVGGNATAGETFSYSAGSLAVFSGDGTSGDVEVDQGSTLGGNSGTVSLITNDAGFANPLISGGSGNSISVAGVGSSASASFGAAVGGDGSSLDSFDLTISDGATISAGNSALGEVKVGLTDAGMQTPSIEGGNGNSISAAALGSSASFSVAASTYDSGAIGAFNVAAGSTLGDLQVDSTNLAAVTLSSDGASAAATKIDTSSIGGGNGNSISSAALGSSGSVSFTNTIFDGANGTAEGEVNFGVINVNSTNSGAIENDTELSTGASIDGGAKNSISVAGIGASASQSLSTTDYAGTAVTAVAVTAGAITLTAFNTAGVTVGGGMTSPLISDGFSNSISAAAVGASASQSVTRTVLAGQ